MLYAEITISGELANEIFNSKTFSFTLSDGEPGNQMKVESATLLVNSGPVPTPAPAAIWLFGSGLIGLVGVRRRLRKKN